MHYLELLIKHQRRSLLLLSSKINSQTKAVALSMKYIHLLILGLVVIVGAQSKAQVETSMSRAERFYKSGQFESSLAVLKKLSSETEDKSDIYYLMGLNYYKTQNCEQAEKLLDQVTRSETSPKVSKAYLYLGLCQYIRKEYDKSVNSLELSLDTSTDAKHDARVDKIIEKVLQAQAQVEKNKLKYTLGFGTTYAYDSNVLSVAETDRSLKGNVLNVAVFGSYKAYADETSTLEPIIFLSDNVTYTSKFEESDYLQSADATQLLVSTPYKTKFTEGNNDISFNVGLFFLPNGNERRKLAIESFFLKENLTYFLSAQNSLAVKIVGGYDHSEVEFSDEEDNQTAVKIDFSIGVRSYLENPKSHMASGDIGFLVNDAKGDDAKYRKLYATVGYSKPQFFKTNETFKINYYKSDYIKSELNRTDTNYNLSYSLAADLTERLSLSGSLSYSESKSTVDEYDYFDHTVGLQLFYVTQF